MKLKLIRATFSDCPDIYRLQIRSFGELLEKYQDYETNPGAEKIERIYERFQQSETDYWMIKLNEEIIGAVRVCDFGTLCKLKQIFILPEFQKKGYAQDTINAVEALYPKAIRWELDTILQEKKLCHLYEKMNYTRTGKIENIKKGMDLVFYAKSLSN